MSNRHRILVMSHAHPDFSLGGGELAAYNLYKSFRCHPQVEDAWFLARADRGRGPTGHITLRRPNEYLWEQAVHDWHRIKAANQESLTTWFADLLRALKPTLVHMHHYAHLGLECIRIIKQVDPAIRVVMTLHEYMAICSNVGQMIKPGTLRLCSRESNDECHQCFPDRSAEDFWLRKQFIQRHFDLIDQFVAPSEFLRQRYVAWGLAPSRIAVIENGQSEPMAAQPRPLAAGRTRNTFGFFGQINPYKGLDVVLSALTQMDRWQRKKLVLEVHGANLEHQPPEFREKIEAMSKPLIKAGVVQWMGPYQPHELPARMAGVDWVLVPSIWWENSPMVIQESFVNGRPVVCSDIGGMAEKVRHGIDGYHVPVGNVLQWSRALATLSGYTDEWERMRAAIRHPLTHAQCCDAHLVLFSAPDAHSALPELVPNPVSPPAPFAIPVSAPANRWRPAAR